MASTSLEHSFSSLSLSSKSLNPSARSFTPFRLRASFSRLPPELKAEIARHVWENDCVEGWVDDGDDYEREEDCQYNPALHALCMVDKQMSEICRPIIWERVDLRRRSLHSLCTFHVCVVPFVGSLIKSLAWDHDSILEASWNWTTGVSAEHFFPNEKPVVKHAEWLTGVDLSLDIFDRRLRAPGLFIGLILPYCPNLRRLDFTAFLRQKTWNSQDGADDALGWIDHAFEAVVRDVPLEQIKELVFRFEMGRQALQVDIPRLFQRLENAESLELENVSDLNEVGLSPENLALLGTLTCLGKLRAFTARNFPMPPAWAPLALPPCLTRLALRNVRPTDRINFVILVNSVSSTLEYLECGSVLSFPGFEGDNRPYLPTIAPSFRPNRQQPLSLPSLRHLAFYHDSTQPSILDLFLDSPITIFTLLGMHYKVRHEAVSFISSLAAKKPRTLRSVKVQKETFDDEEAALVSYLSRRKGEVDVVKELCKAVEVDFEEVDEDPGFYEHGWSPADETGLPLFAYLFA